MSSVTRHKGSKYWSARFRTATGVRVTRTTKMVERRKAQALADKWEEVGKGELTVTQIQRVTCDIHKEITGVSVPSHTVRGFLKHWLSHKEPEVAASSAEKYGYTVEEFLRHLGPRADGPLRQVTEADLKSYRDACRKMTRPKTTNGKLVVIAAALREAWMDGYIPDDIAKRLKKIKVRTQTALEKLPFTQQQVDRIIENTEGEWKGIALLGAYTGQRLGDIVSLRWGDIGPSGMTFVSRKTGKPMSIPVVHPMALDWLKENNKAQDRKAPLFPQSFATYVKNRDKVAALSKQFRVLLASLGYSEKREYRSQGKGRGALRSFCPLSFHSFRHYLTTELHRLGVPGAVVREIIGHDSEYVSRLYTHIGDEAKRAALEQLAKAHDTTRTAMQLEQPQVEDEA